MSFVPLHKLPVDRGFYLQHPDTDLMAVVAPAPSKGLSYLGIFDAGTAPWRFTVGPSIVRTLEAGDKLRKMGTAWERAELEIDDGHLSAAASPDDLIDLVTMEVKL